jgi:colicin import membrane protein
MANARDDSMVFSLRGLLLRERQRLEREAADRRRQEEVALALRAERERVRREAEDRKRHSLVEVARLEQQRRREEEARLEALKHAAVECARTEAESRSRVELLEKQQLHERVLAELSEQTRRERARHLAIAGFAMFAFSAIAAAALYFAKLRPEASRLQFAYDELVSAEHNRAEETKRLLERAEKRRNDLATELENAKQRIEALEREGRDTPPAAKREGAKSAGSAPSR